MEWIVNSWEIESFVENFKVMELETYGTERWFEHHKFLMLLSQQSVLEINNMREEFVKEAFVSQKKTPVLVVEAIQVEVWKKKVFPLLIEFHGEPTNTIILYSILYHENVVVSLLENVLYHSDSVESMEDCLLDLIDYSVSHVLALVCHQKHDSKDKTIDQNSCLEELEEKRRELDFDIGIKCISILRYFAEFAENLPLYALNRMLVVHDIPCLFVELIEKKPWKRKDDNGEIEIYSGKWEKIKDDEFNKVSKTEGQIWIGLREFLLNPKCNSYYEINEFRSSVLTKLQKYLNEELLDQISPLIDLRRYICNLSMSSLPNNTRSSVNVELLPQIKNSILEKHYKKWKKLTKHQAKCLLNKDVDYVKKIAQILSDAYDVDKLESNSSKHCFLCSKDASQRCSVCKEAWYCSRSCQVNDWSSHKSICERMTRLNVEGDNNSSKE